ncbi:MAG: hypothetical protein ABIW30_06835 [Arenimonas sp.]
MRHPERWRNFALTCVASGPLAMFAAYQLPPAAAGVGVRTVLACYALMAIVFGGIAALVWQPAVKAKRRMDRGEGLIARWRVEAPEWREFLAWDREQVASGERALNFFSPRKEVSPHGVEILVADDAIQIDGSTHALPRHGTPQVTHSELDEARARPSVLELGLSFPASESGPAFTRLCFPVARGKEQEARAVVGYFREGRPGKATFFHGSGDGRNSEDLSKCWQCGYETHQFIDTCPQCGAGLLSRRWARRFGGVQVVLGLLLTSGLGLLLRILTPTLLRAGHSVGGTRFNGSKAQALGVFAILLAVFVFGLITLVYGAWQVRTGGRSPRVVAVMVAIAGTLYVVGLLF